MEPKIQKITHDLESQSSSSVSARMVVSVDDLLIEIFLRLPMKSLGRFKSVSKHWQSLISDPGFSIRRNPNPNPATSLIIQVPLESASIKSALYAYIVSFDTSPQIRTLNFINYTRPYDTTTVMSSCNGLIFMCRSYENHGSVYEYYVCNPTTNKYFKLPQIPDEPDWMRLRSMCMAFDPSKSPHYKVVCSLILCYGTKCLYKFMVYSSETGCWRKSSVKPFRAASVDFERGVYWNGAMHWVSFKKTGKSIYFDPNDDRMSREIMPTPPRVNKYYYYFGESCGHLHYIDNSWNWRFDVHEMRRDYSEWFSKYRINHHDPLSSVGRQKPYLCAVVRGKSHDDGDSFSVLLIGGKLVRYYFLNKTLETICEVEGAPFEQCITYVPAYIPFQHAESLCSV